MNKGDGPVKEAEHSFARRLPSGLTLRARLEYDEGDARIAIQWLQPSGKPNHSPLYFGADSAASFLDELAAFARSVAAERALDDAAKPVKRRSR
jgi:hypothetical protein